MSTPHKNESPVSAGQFVKTQTKYATDFIARCIVFVCNDAGLCVLAAVVAIQAVLLVLKVMP